MREVRDLVLKILVRSEIERVPTDPLLAPRLARSRLDERDRRLVTTLVKTTHRWRGRADRVLDLRLNRGIRSLDVRTLNILRLAYVQLYHLDQIPVHAIVHTAVDLAMIKVGSGKAKLVNRILRGLVSSAPTEKDWSRGEGVQRLEGELSHPGWLLERWVPRWGEDEVRRICTWNNSTPSFHLRLHGTEAERENARDTLRDEGLEITPGAVTPESVRVNGSFPVQRHALMKAGRLVPQDESQTLVGLLMPLVGSGPILDLCASPGTKASHLAARFPDVPVIASDLSRRNVKRILQTRERLGLPNLSVVAANGMASPYRPTAPAVLLDAPCTGLGVLQRRPDARWLRCPGDLTDAVRTQRELLAAAAPLVAPGGTLLYSVCSLETEECQEQAEWFLQSFPDFEPGQLPEWVPESLSSGAGQMCVPSGTLGMEGCFAVLLRRKEGT